MRLVIIGGGRIGRAIARDTAARGHQVVVIERLAGRCQSLIDAPDITVIEGDATGLSYLEQAHTDLADAVVATTHDDDVNLVTCQLAMVEFKVRRAISRVIAPENVAIFEALGIETVSSTRAISELLEQSVGAEDTTRITRLNRGRVQLIQVQVSTRPQSRRRRRIDELDLPRESVIALIVRGDELLIPRGDTAIEPGDVVVALAPTGLRDRVQMELSDPRR